MDRVSGVRPVGGATLPAAQRVRLQALPRVGVPQSAQESVRSALFLFPDDAGVMLLTHDLIATNSGPIQLESIIRSRRQRFADRALTATLPSVNLAVAFGRKRHLPTLPGHSRSHRRHQLR